MADIIELIKKQSEKTVSEIRELTGKLSEQLKHLIKMIPEETRSKSVESFLNDIRTGVLGEKKPRRSVKKTKGATASRRGRKPGKVARKRGKKKKEAMPEEAGKN